MSDAARLNPRDWSRHPPPLSPGYRTSVARNPRRPLLTMPPEAQALTGPVFGDDAVGPQDHDLLTNFARAGETALGARILLHGRVLGEDNRPVPGALIELWQANAGGR